MPLDLLEEDVIWVAYKHPGAAGAMGAEVIELSNWLLCFRCALDEIRVVVANLEDLMANSPPQLGCLP